MLNWGVSKESTSKFVLDMAGRNGLSKADVTSIEVLSSLRNVFKFMICV